MLSECGSTPFMIPEDATVWLDNLHKDCLLYSRRKMNINILAINVHVC